MKNQLQVLFLVLFCLFFLPSAGWALEGLVLKATGTGRTTGHIADLTVTNNGSRTQVLKIGPALIPATGKYQSYVVPGTQQAQVKPGQSSIIPVSGYCTDIFRPPVPAGEPMVPFDEWIGPTPIPPVSDIQITATGPYQPRPASEAAGGLRATIPGTNAPVPFAIDINKEPASAAPFLLSAITAAEDAYERLREDGKIKTPYSAAPERERAALVQQTIWIYTADLEGKKYTKEDFNNRMQAQLETSSGKKLEEAPPPVQEQFKQGVDAFWDSFKLVGVEAKIISAETTPEPETPAVPVEQQGCTPEKTEEHTPKEVAVAIADSYGTEEDRQAIRKGIQENVASDANAYATSTPPSTSYAIWGHDHIGGISSAYAKTIFLKLEGGDEWVWSTDPMTVNADGTGTHTLAFVHGPECSAVVAGAALMWLKANSEAFDPLEQNIEIFRALDKVKEVTVEYLADKLPPGLSDAMEAGVEAITDPSSDTYAAASGEATLTVGTDKTTDKAVNRVVYKREGKEDKAIIGGGVTIRKLFASDVQPDSLTSTLNGVVTMEGGATGNGFAKAYLESLYGTLLVGICECPEGITYEILTDTGLFIRSEAVQGTVQRAMQEMQDAAERIGKAIAEGELEPTGENLRAEAEKELRGWAESIGGDRFNPAE